MKIALVIGHKQSSKGACNVSSNLYEFDYNEGLAKKVQQYLSDYNIEAPLVYRKSYKDLPDDINKLNPDYIISFHCNAFNTMVSGSEVLYYYKSERSRVLAELMQDTIVNSLFISDREIKGKSTEDRGGTLLRYTNAPCVILEPFFIDNDNDLYIGNINKDRLASDIAAALLTLI